MSKKPRPSDPSPEISADRLNAVSVRNWSQTPDDTLDQMQSNVAIAMGWGRLIFGHTFESQDHLVQLLCEEEAGKRDIALYLRDPHVVVSLAPDRLFLDPSHTYRLWRDCYATDTRPVPGVTIKPAMTPEHAIGLQRIYMEWGMVAPKPDDILRVNANKTATYFVAEGPDQHILGGILCVDHVAAFQDPERGSSFWCLAVGRDCSIPGLGEAMVRHAVDHFYALGREHVDLSVLHSNAEAIALYEKLGFQRVPVFCVKHKNQINETFFVRETGDEGLNPYAQILVDEARRRGIYAEIIDAEYNIFTLQHAGRSVTCRESLSELTSAVALTRCDDKRLTRRILTKADLHVPDQAVAIGNEEDQAFLQKHRRIVIKPAQGEQGRGVTVDVRTASGMRQAIEQAQKQCDRVLLEQFVEGEDLRIIVIGDEVVAAAVRQPATITGAENRTIANLIERYNRRRLAATGGESAVPMDDDTIQCVHEAGFALEDPLPDGASIQVRKTANLHTGGTIHDVTDDLHPHLRDMAIAAARALDILVVGLDLIVPDVTKPEYVIIEANERPGLANHEPQPTAERFVDLLFPQTRRNTP